MLQLNYSKFILETGTDEAGRGCLAGPVTAAAVILPANFENKILNDSKQLSEKVREQLKPIIEQQALCFAVTHLDNISSSNAFFSSGYKLVNKI